MIYIIYFINTFMVYAFLTHKRQALSIVSIMTFLFLSLSYPSGGDWIGYFNHYDCNVNNACQSGFIMFEPGYELIVKIVGQFGFQPIIVFIAFINVFLLYRFARNYEKSAFIIIALMCMFLWSVYVEAIRQALAVSLIAYGMNSLFIGNIKKFVFIVLIASTFHITAIICLLFLTPHFSLKLNKVVSYSLVIFSVTFFALANIILNTVVTLLPVGTIASEKLSFYLASEQYKPQLSIGSGTALDILLIFLIIISFHRLKKNSLSNYKAFNGVLLIGCCLYISFGILIGKMMPVMTRIGWYGIPVVLTLLYTNIGASSYYKKYQPRNIINYSKFLIYLYFGLQIIRPLTYDYSYYNIMHQQTIIENIDSLDDVSLRKSATDKCRELGQLGYGYLCSI